MSRGRTNRGFCVHGRYRAPDGTLYVALPTQQEDWDRGLGSVVIESSSVATDCGRCVLLPRERFDDFELVSTSTGGYRS